MRKGGAMKFFLIFTSFVFVCFYGLTATAQENQTVTGKHAENGLICEDCHETDKPVKKASQKVCIACHGEIPGAVNKYHDGGKPMEFNVHDSHQGSIRCTICHSSHGTPKLYCAECHKFEDIVVK